ncbi:MAG: acetyl-CoA C-acetyltransferase [Planctomycetes bacterium]|nr:acetyl-CoA C-acetyltransferase [Planctomycetota bacterium]
MDQRHDKRDIVLLGGARTAMAEYSGTPGYGKLKEFTAVDLAAIALKGAFQKTGVIPAQIDHTIVGNAAQTANDAIYGARHVALKAGVPIEKPALTVNRLCGSGIQSIISGAQHLLLGEGSMIAAGGMENMSQAPYVLRGARDGFRLGQQPTLEDSLFSSLMDGFCGFYMAQTAENLAKKMGITREAQDEYALRSHQLGAEAVEKKLFAEEIVPVVVEKRGQKVAIDQDDHIKPETTLAGLAALRPAFGKDGTVTAGNASGIVDGAAAVILATADAAKRNGLKPMGRIVEWSVVGVPPEIMGIGPAPAIRDVLKKAGLDLAQIDLFEINEAFSAQYLAVEKDLGLDRAKCNVNGGAIALGHPLGATGTRLVLTLLHQLRRTGKRYGIASACIGGGQGIALLIENIQ